MDFDAIVAAALKTGMTAEDCASRFADALNKTKKELEGKPNSREAIIQDFSHVFDEHVKEEHLDLSDAAALIWLSIVKDTEDGKAMNDVDELNELYDFILDDVNVTLDKWKIRKAISDLLPSGKRCKCKNETRERKTGTDRESIERFLKSFGWW